MKPQTIVVVVASVVTAMFLAAVGLVLAWPLLTVQRDGGGFKLGVDLVGGPQPELQAPVEKPIAKAELAKVRGAVVPANEYTLSAPQTHGNLTIYLIHGNDTIKNSKMLTLQEGLEQNVAIVHDAGVLTIDNRGNAPLFIQAGDIVKGGNQDRTLPYDMLVPAHSQGTPIAALCVEQGRSFPRGDEASASFATSTEQLPGRQLRIAAYRQNQGEVWNNVRAMQDNLARNAGGSVQAPLSNTSLQLSLEHHRVQGAVQNYLANLALPPIEGKNDVIGYAVVVNGKIHSADVYASSALFQKLWPKLIRASAVEALAERHRDAIDPPDAKAVQAFLAAAEKGEAFRIEGAANRGVVIRHETAQALLHDTCDPTQENLVLHRSVLAK